MIRDVLTDAQWAVIAPVLPTEPAEPQPANRLFFEATGILWSHGALWEAWPAELGDYKKAYRRAMQWGIDGIWAKVAPLLPDTSSMRGPLQKALSEFEAFSEDEYPFLSDFQWAIISPILPPEPEGSQLSNQDFVEEILWMRIGGHVSWTGKAGSSAVAMQRVKEWQTQNVWVILAAGLPPKSIIRQEFLALAGKPHASNQQNGTGKPAAKKK